MLKRILYILPLLLLSNLIFSQSEKQRFYLNIYTNNKIISKKLRFNQNHKDSLSIIQELNAVKTKWQNKGFIEANYDSILWEGTTVRAKLHVGKTYQWNKITLSDSIKNELKGTFRYREKIFTNQALSLHEFLEFTESILKEFENNGYPFVKVRYINTKFISSNEIASELWVDKGPLVNITKIHVKGPGKIHPKFVYTHLQIKPGQAYSEVALSRISKRILEISFVSEIKPHEVLFTQEGAELFLYLQTSKSSNANGIIGIQPNNQTGKVNVTGEVKLKLQNLLKRGELFRLEWRKMQPQTQDFLVHINYPYLFGSSFGVDGQFKLYKRDSSFLNLNANIGLQYALKGSNYLKAFYEFESSDLLILPANLTQNSIVDIRKNNYGIGFLKGQYDYRPNPRKGYQIELSANIGSKVLKKKNDVPDSLYNDIKLRDINYGLQFKGDVFIPFFKRHTFRIANQTSVIFADELFTNEALRFGGFNTLRGFDEELFYTTFYSVFTIEYRFLIDYRSAVFAFFDQGLYETNTRGNYDKDTPFGFGIGLNMGTKIGTFQLSYAFGKQKNQPLLIRNGKIHFGYIAYF